MLEKFENFCYKGTRIIIYDRIFFILIPKLLFIHHFKFNLLIYLKVFKFILSSNLISFNIDSQ